MLLSQSVVSLCNFSHLKCRNVFENVIFCLCICLLTKIYRLFHCSNSIFRFLSTFSQLLFVFRLWKLFYNFICCDKLQYNKLFSIIPLYRLIVSFLQAFLFKKVAETIKFYDWEMHSAVLLWHLWAKGFQFGPVFICCLRFPPLERNRLWQKEKDL